MVINRLLHILFIVTCGIGFLIQSSYVTFAYLSYSTQTKIVMYNPEKLAAPGVSICLDPGVLSRNNSNNSLMWDARFANLTLRQLFQASPKPEEVLASCGTRVPGESVIDFKSRNCLNKFYVNRFVMQDSICYKLHLKNLAVYDFESTSQEDYGRVYRLALHSQITLNANFITVIIQSDDSYPVVSRYYSIFLIRDSSRLFSDNYYQFAYAVYNIHRLPWPYDSSCEPDHKHAIYSCRTRCLADQVKKNFNILPSALILPESPARDWIDYDLKIITFRDYQNGSFYKQYRMLSDMCKLKCKKLLCNEELRKTDIMFVGDRNGQREMIISIFLPQSPSTDITYEAKFLLNDYIIYVMSCLGTWLGISVINLNPIKFFERRLAQPLANRHTCRKDHLLLLKRMHMMNKQINKLMAAQ